MFPMNSDFFPVLDQRAPVARFRGDNAQELAASRDMLVPVVAMLDGETRTPVRRISQGGINRPIRVDRTLIGAEMVGVFLTGKADHARVLSGDEKSAALLARNLLDQCVGSEVEWANAVSEVVGLSSPFPRALRRRHRLREDPCLGVLAIARRGDAPPHPAPRGDQRSQSRCDAQGGRGAARDALAGRRGWAACGPPRGRDGAPGEGNEG
jgi:hypothetical protein